ncbi:MAG TPA: cystatin domain-containing protein [Pyrinomonadaceae bacterium]|nr:cystatin domain-containing protein [Pyrinomonadaceae bacterium]
MKKSLHALMVLAALGIAFGCAAVGLGQGRPIVGGFKEAATDDAEVVAAADFAVSARREQEGVPLSLVSIKRAERQVVQGTNFRLCLEVKAADETDAEVDTQDVQAVVWQKLTRPGEDRQYQLTKWEVADCGGGDSGRNHAAPLTGTRESLPADPATSVYSSLSNCKRVSLDSESGASTLACRGVGGYNLRLEYSDARESITVISPDGKQHPLNFWEVISTGFSSVGQKAEWRVTKEKGRVVPRALIVRFNTSDGPEDSTKLTSYLAVAKITPGRICVTDKIAPSATANDEARRAADASAAKPCLEAPAQDH